MVNNLMVLRQWKTGGMVEIHYLSVMAQPQEGRDAVEGVRRSLALSLFRV